MPQAHQTVAAASVYKEHKISTEDLWGSLLVRIVPKSNRGDCMPFLRMIAKNQKVTVSELLYLFRYEIFEIRARKKAEETQRILQLVKRINLKKY